MKAFDIDGTLLDYGATPGSDPIINESLIATLAKGERIALVTNQGGLAFGLEGNSPKFPSPADFVWRLIHLVDYLTDRGIAVDSIHVCTYSLRSGEHPSWQASKAVRAQVPFAISDLMFLHHTLEWRKPGPAMLTASKANVYYGDSDEDEDAAAAAHIPFVRVERFTADGGGQPINLMPCQKCGRRDKVILPGGEQWCEECGRTKVVYLAPSLTGECPPFNSQLWMGHETEHDYAYTADEELIAAWAEDNMLADSIIWLKHELSDESPAKCFEVYIAWFAREVIE